MASDPSAVDYEVVIPELRASECVFRIHDVARHAAQHKRRPRRAPISRFLSSETVVLRERSPSRPIAKLDLESGSVISRDGKFPVLWSDADIDDARTSSSMPWRCCRACSIWEAAPGAGTLRYPIGPG